MSTQDVILRGFGNGTETGSISKFVLRGFSLGAGINGFVSVTATGDAANTAVSAVSPSATAVLGITPLPTVAGASPTSIVSGEDVTGREPSPTTTGTGE